ncbi:hypothetical protein BTO06_08290 [Tenacibaculum sp. SZ-18]|uniref:hypothetical protein n=1 Tax=Tenacibaculum sp. SZ-18 TaxID=754423 RepID=UPI000C2D624E|nr:hypothetical protein [Tenacibaculum sp. SZ-18]AUC15135.1 hypothetical protein BTO06_08290 [Tenacibaculum sp. SZ-18]
MSIAYIKSNRCIDTSITITNVSQQIKEKMSYSFVFNEMSDYRMIVTAKKIIDSYINIIKTFITVQRKIYQIGISGGYRFISTPQNGVTSLPTSLDKYNTEIYVVSEFSFNGFLLSASHNFKLKLYRIANYYFKSRWNSLNYDQDLSNYLSLICNIQYTVNPKFNYNKISASTFILFLLAYYEGDRYTICSSYKTYNSYVVFINGLCYNDGIKSSRKKNIQPGISNFTNNNKLDNIIKSDIEKNAKQALNIFHHKFKSTKGGSFVATETRHPHAALLSIDTHVTYNSNENIFYRIHLH